MTDLCLPFFVLVLAPLGAAESGPTEAEARVRAVAEQRPARAADLIQDGLRWLCRHQRDDGSWAIEGLRQKCTSKPPCFDEKEVHAGSNYDVGCTGLALLAFLGAGYGPDSKIEIADATSKSRFKTGEVVRKGVAWLMQMQKGEGYFSDQRPYMYNESIATRSLCEAYRVGRDRGVRDAAQRALDYVAGAQRPMPLSEKRELGGWSYDSLQDYVDFNKDKPHGEEYDNGLWEADLSNTAWAVLALAAGKNAGLKVKKEPFDGALRFLAWLTPPDDQGYVGYKDPKGAGGKVTGTRFDQFDYHKPSMSALAIVVRLSSERDFADPFLERAANLLLDEPPRVGTDLRSVDYDYWYCGTVAINRFDGPGSLRKPGKKYASPWNAAMLDAAVAMQDHRADRCSGGGWIEMDRWAYTGGPIYSTAITVLTLEQLPK